MLIIVAAASYQVLAVCAFVIVTVLLSLDLCFQLDNFPLHAFILHHDLMQLCLRAGQVVELLDEVLVDRLLKLIDLFDQFAEPVAVRTQVLASFQFLDGYRILVNKDVFNPVLILQDII